MKNATQPLLRLYRIPVIIVCACLLGPVGITAQVIDFDKPSVYNGYFRKQADTTVPSIPELVPLLNNAAAIGSDHTGSTTNTPMVMNVPMSSGASYLHPHIPNIHAVDRSKAVGEIPISSGVSPSGGMSYTVPIEVAPGVQGMQPNLSITYNSQGGNGVLGMGWGIGGLSAITRANQSYYYDGKTEAASLQLIYTALDGMRLIPTSPGIYEECVTEQGNIRVLMYRFVYNNTYPPQYYKALFPNGNVAIYGSEDNNIPLFSYPLTSLTDKQGNYVRFHYIFRNGHHYLDRVTYGNTIGGIPQVTASIKFNYRIRSDVQSVYLAEEKVTEDYLLNSIVCYNGTNQTLRTYSFTYQANRQSLLTQIDCNVGGSNLNPLKFFYGVDGQITGFRNEETLLWSYFPNTLSSGLEVTKGKFEAYSDDDGLIIYPNKNPYIANANSTSVRWDNEFHPNQQLLVYHGLKNYSAFPQPLTAGTGFVRLFSADIDGSGGEEVIKVNNYCPRTILGMGIGNKFDFSIYKSIPLPPSTGQTSMLQFNRTVSYDLSAQFGALLPFQLLPGDFNGDGKMEIFAISTKTYVGNFSNGEKNSYTYVFNLEDHSILCEGFVFNFKLGDFLYMLDYNGDGKTDICHIHSSGLDVYSYSVSDGQISRKGNTNTEFTKNTLLNRKLLLGDVNGDGKTDILLSPPASYMSYRIVTVPVSIYRYCPNCNKDNEEGRTHCSDCNTSLLNSPCCFSCGAILRPYNPGDPWMLYTAGHDTDSLFLQEHEHELYADYLLTDFDQPMPWGDMVCPFCGSSTTGWVPEYIDNGKTWNIYTSKSTGQFEVNYQIITKYEKDEEFILQDVNGDGLSDIIRRENNGKLSSYLNTNGMFNSTAEPNPSTVASGTRLISSVVAMNNYHSQVLAIYNETVYKLAFTRNDAQQALLTAAVNSLGAVSKTDYMRLNESRYGENCYTKGSGAAFPYDNFTGPLFVASKTQSFWNSDTPLASMSYRYTNAVIHKQGLGFCGFEKIAATDELRGQTLEKIFRPYDFGVPLSEESPAFKTNYNFNVALAANKTRKIQLLGKTEIDKLKNNTVTSSYTGYDAYNYPILEKISYADGYVRQTRRTYLHKTETDNYALGLPLSQTVTVQLPAQAMELNGMQGANGFITPIDIIIADPLFPPGDDPPPIDPPVFPPDSIIDIDPPIFPPDTIPWTPWIETSQSRTDYTYNAQNRPLTQKNYIDEAQTGERVWTYDSFGNVLTEKTKPYNAVEWLTTAYEYDFIGRFMTKTTDAMGLQTHYAGFNAFGQPGTVTDFRGNVTTYTYDVFGRTTATVYPDGTTATQSYAWNNAVDKAVFAVSDSATGAPASITWYDAFGRVVKQGTRGFDGVYVYIDRLYDTYGRLHKESEPYTANSTPRRTEYTYDNYDRVTKAAAPSGRRVTYSYNGNTVTENNAGLTTTKTYDARGQLVSATDPGGTVNYTYRADGQPSKVTVAGVSTTFEYDIYGRQQAINDPSAGRQSYTYDAAGNMATQTDAENRTVSTTYNIFGQPLTSTYPEFTLTYAYDPDYYMLTSVTSSNGTVQSYTYDNLGRVKTATEHIDQTAFTKTYTYAAGKVASMTYSPVSQPVNYCYNQYGYLNELKLGSQSVWKLNTANHFGQPLSEMLGNSVVQTNTYTADGLPNQLKAAKGSNVLQQMQYGYDAARGLLTSRYDYVNRVNEDFVYDNLNRLTNFGASSVEYSNNGNITRKTDAGNLQYGLPDRPYALTGQQFRADTVGHIRYIRDWLGGSWGSRENNWVEIQALDENGNNVALGKPVSTPIELLRNIEVITDGNTDSDQYASCRNSSMGEQYVTVDLGQVYPIAAVKVWHSCEGGFYYNSKTKVSADGIHWHTLHDAATDGEYMEPLCDGRTYLLPLTTPFRNQEVSYTSFRRPATIEENGYHAEFTYLPNHQRAKMQVKLNNNLLLNRYYLGDNYEKETNAHGAITAERIYLGGTAYNAPAVLCNENGQWKLRYIHRDHLNSITAISDENGHKIAEYSYDAWGRLRPPQASHNYDAWGNVQNPQEQTPYGPNAQPALYLGRGYTGHEHLPWFGLINMNARLYDPVLGRFLSPDPYVQLPDFTQSYNRYTYAMNNPLMFVDWTGMEWDAQWEELLREYDIDPSTLMQDMEIVAPAWDGGGSSNRSDSPMSGSGYYGGSFWNGYGDYAGGEYAGGSYGGGSNGAKNTSAYDYAAYRKAYNDYLNARRQAYYDQQIAWMQQQVRYGQTAFINSPQVQFAMNVTLFVTTGGIEGLLSLGKLGVQGFQALSKLGLREAAKGGVKYSDDLVKNAQKLYPKKAGTTELHHIKPQYLGGPKSGPTVPLNGSYHQVITNEFRMQWPYGKGFPTDAEWLQIYKNVYSKYPLPPGF